MLYRRFLRVAAQMPTAGRRHFIQQAARDGFRRKQHLETPEEVAAALALGQTLLDQAAAQAQHLQACARAGLLEMEDRSE